MNKKLISILGATGSIGQSTLSVIKAYPDKFEVYTLTAQKNHQELFKLCIEHQPQYAVLIDENSAELLEKKISQTNCKTQVLCGEESLFAVTKKPQVDIVVSAIVGTAGLLPTYHAIQANKRILLANKESLVIAGKIIMERAREVNAEIIPIDSEHNAIFQLLSQPAIDQRTLLDRNISRIILTASGGPFLNKSDLSNVSVQEALSHPNWKMGQKITIDSATLMNKGLEVIEAYHLFNAKISEIEVVIHPQSIIHAMVEHIDGSIFSHLGYPDMKIPISYALAYPNRLICDEVPKLNFDQLKSLTFSSPDITRFPCLNLAISALKQGGTATAILNSANEVAVIAFLNKKIRFTDIDKLVEKTLEKITIDIASDINNLLEKSKMAQEVAMNEMHRFVYQ